MDLYTVTRYVAGQLSNFDHYTNAQTAAENAIAACEGQSTKNAAQVQSDLNSSGRCTLILSEENTVDVTKKSVVIPTEQVKKKTVSE